jgi:hypothetical protein
MRQQQVSTEFVTVSQLNNPATRSYSGQVRSMTVDLRRSGHPTVLLLSFVQSDNRSVRYKKKEKTIEP